LRWDERRATPSGLATGPEVAEAGELETSRVSIEPLGDEREAARFTVPISSEGIEVDLVIDVVFVRVGRAIALLTVADAFNVFDEDLKAELTSKMVRSLSSAVV
jgi:hypothetical protein